MSAAGARALVAAAGLLAACVTPALGQEARVGLSLAGVRATYDGPPTTAFEQRTGFAAGVFADVTTPVAPLLVRVGGRWVRRGGNTTDGGGAEMDLLGVPLAVGARIALGPLGLQPSLGVEVAYPLAARKSPDLDRAFGDGPGMEAGAFVGLELQVDLGRRFRLGLEARRLRGLGAAFEGPGGRLETRATEVVVRLSRPLQRPAPAG